MTVMQHTPNYHLSTLRRYLEHRRRRLRFDRADKEETELLNEAQESLTALDEHVRKWGMQ